MKFEQVWLGKAVRPGPGDEGVVFELLGRTRSGGYYRMTLPVLPQEKPERELVGLGLLQYWFREHGYDVPGWVEDELRESGDAFAKSDWNPAAEERKVEMAQAQGVAEKRFQDELLRENELLRLQLEFLKMLGSKW